MKNPRHPSRNPLALLAALLTTAFAPAALIPTEWSHRQTLTVAAPGLVRVDLTAASFDAAGPRQEDLRVIDSTGREVAFLLDRPTASAAHTVRPEAFAMKLGTESSVLTIKTGTHDALASLTLETPSPYFLRAARLEISDDNENWTMLDQGLPLFRQWGAVKLDLSLGGHHAAYVRVTIVDGRGPSVPFTGARLRLDGGQPSAPVPVGTRVASREEFAGETVLSLALDGRHVPLAALELATQEPLFMRRVTVAVREFRDGISSERAIGEGTIYRVALDGSPARAQLELPLDCTPLTRELLVHIHNGDSPPLAIAGVQAKRRPMDLRFMAPAAGNYTLLLDNPQATAPHYDLALFAGEMRDAHAMPVTPGELEPMPGYRPRESLSAASLPEVPLTGAPLDTKNWSHRRPLQITRAGVQELELDVATLAAARSDYADLRVLHGENQIPFVLERPGLARALTLTPVSAPDAKRPGVSVWQLRLPHTGLPLQRLTLTSGTLLFQREFRIYEKLTGTDGRHYVNTLGTGAWSRTPEAGTPETRNFDLPDRPRTDTLLIETDNGDNPPIALGAVRAVYPVVRLVFKVAEPDGFLLAYDNPTASAPHYDLSLVAARLLTAPRNVAQLAAGGATAGDRNPFAGLNGGYLFWGTLALVVVVLLVVVAKLLPKPPTGE